MPDQDDTNWGKLAAIGFEVAIGVGLGALVGNWIDRKFSTAPWGVAIGSMVGCAGGIYLLIKKAVWINKD